MIIVAAQRIHSVIKPPLVGLRHTAVRNLAIPSRWYTLPEAIDTLRKRRKFDHWSFQVSFNLNIDPRKEGHDICGAVVLPHSFGHSAERTRAVLALTADPALAQQALDAGAHRAGDLLYEVQKSIVLLRNYDILVATKDLKRRLTRTNSSLQRKLKRAGLTPSVESRTLVKPEDFVHTVEKYVNYTMMQWKSDSHGNVTVPLGKILLPTQEIVENFQCVLQELYAVKPIDFGTGPRGRKKNRGKYVLGVFLKMTEGKALPIDLSTLEGCEHYGRGPPPYYTENGMPYPIDSSRHKDGDDDDDTSPPPQPRIQVLPNGHPVKPIVIERKYNDRTLL